MEITNKNFTISFELDNQRIEELKNYYKNYVIDSNQQYVDFTVKKSGLNITVYKSNKIVFQGKDALEESLIWDIKENSWVDENEQIGSDEVGTGDYFGPICVCAAHVEKKHLKLIKELGVDDSKKLSDSKIREIAPILIENINYSQISLSARKYNQLTTNKINQGEIKALLHNQALYNLKEKIKKDKINTYIDQFVTKEKYFEYLKGQENIVSDVIFETKADGKYPSVAVASIIARFSFLLKLDSYEKYLGEVVPKGAGPEVDKFAKKISKKLSIGEYKNFVKYHFSNTKKIGLN